MNNNYQDILLSGDAIEPEEFLKWQIDDGLITREEVDSELVLDMKMVNLAYRTRGLDTQSKPMTSPFERHVTCPDGVYSFTVTDGTASGCALLGSPNQASCLAGSRRCVTGSVRCSTSQYSRLSIAKL